MRLRNKMELGKNDNKIEKLAQELSELTGKPAEELIIKSLEERLEKEKQIDNTSLKDKLLAIAERYSKLPTLDSRDADEILGYK